MSYADTVDYQAKKFGAGATVSIFVAAAAGMFLNISFLPDPPKMPERDRSLVVFPVPGIKEKQSTMKVFDVPEPVKPEPKPKPKPKPVPEPPAEPQKAASEQVDQSKPDPDQAEAREALGLPTFWTPPPPKVAKERQEVKEVKKVELPKLTVNDTMSEKKMDVNRPPRLVQAREQRMDDSEVITAVRRLQQQLSATPRPQSGGSAQTRDDQQSIDDGTVALRFQVMPDGRISGCTVVVSSGSDVLDRRACDLVGSFVYEAGTDEKGTKVEKTMIETIEWLGAGDARRGSDGRTVTPSRVVPTAQPIIPSTARRR